MASLIRQTNEYSNMNINFYINLYILYNLNLSLIVSRKNPSKNPKTHSVYLRFLSFRFHHIDTTCWTQSMANIIKILDLSSSIRTPTAQVHDCPERLLSFLGLVTIFTGSNDGGGRRREPVRLSSGSHIVSDTLIHRSDHVIPPA